MNNTHEQPKPQLPHSIKGMFHCSETFQAYMQLFDDYVELARWQEEKKANHDQTRANLNAVKQIQKILLRIIENKKIIGENYESEIKELSLLAINYNVIM